MPITTGSIGTSAWRYSSRIFMARHQKWDGVQTNTRKPTRNPSRSSVPVAAAQPAHDAALPAMPPITMFDVLRRLSQAVYTTTYEKMPSAIKAAAAALSAAYPYTTEAALAARPYARTALADMRPDGMGRPLVLSIFGSMSRS